VVQHITAHFGADLLTGAKHPAFLTIFTDTSKTKHNYNV